MIKRHRMNYTPWIPHPKIVRTRGFVNQTALTIFWRYWVIDIEGRHLLAAWDFLKLAVCAVLALAGLWLAMIIAFCL